MREMKKIMTMKNIWVCIDSNGSPQLSTYHYTKRDSKKEAISQLIDKDWNWFKKNGWQCIKVDITITPQ